MKPSKPTTKKLIPGSNSGKMASALQKPKVVKTTTAVKKTSRPSVAAGAPKTAPKTNKKITVTGSATGTKSLTAAQVARFNKLAGNTKMGNR
jgi:hypothetical protein